MKNSFFSRLTASLILGCVVSFSALPTVSARAAETARDYKVGEIVLSDPYIRATPKGAKVAGAYVKITNNAHHPDRLISANVEVAGMTMIHEMKMDGAVMKMAELPDGIAIAAHQTVELEPGAFHLMLMDLKAPVREGDVIKGSLTFKNAGRVEVDFLVRGMGAK